jgi:transposase-like protein
VYLEERLWPNGTFCPTCAGQDRITVRKGGFIAAINASWISRFAPARFSSGLISSLHKWIYAMYLMVTARKGISSMQLAKEIGITQKSAWFMLQRLREACAGKGGKLNGIVEIDEAFIGGKEANKHESKKLKMGRGAVGKAAVMGLA